MNNVDRNESDNAALNPALKSAQESVYDVDRTAAPLETVSVGENQHTPWPTIWAIVLVLCVMLTLYLLLA